MTEDVVEEPEEYATSWTQRPDGTFNHIAKEKFALALAAGKTIGEASDEVGLTARQGKEWAKRYEMRIRKRDLRATPAVSQTFSVSVAMIVAELYTNSTMARNDGDYKAANDALIQMYRIAKAEKSLLETFDAQIASGGSSSSDDIVKALQGHLSKAEGAGARK